MPHPLKVTSLEQTIALEKSETTCQRAKSARETETPPAEDVSITPSNRCHRSVIIISFFYFKIAHNRVLIS